jgi:hypothetical protein
MNGQSIALSMNVKVVTLLQVHKLHTKTSLAVLLVQLWIGPLMRLDIVVCVVCALHPEQITLDKDFC